MSEKGRESDRASAQDIASALESQGSGGYRKIQLVETATRVSSFGPQTRVSVCLIRTGEREREREGGRGEKQRGNEKTEGEKHAPVAGGMGEMQKKAAAREDSERRKEWTRDVMKKTVEWSRGGCYDGK